MQTRGLAAALVLFASTLAAGCSARSDRQDDGAQPTSAAAATARLGGNFRKKEGHAVAPVGACFKTIALGTEVLDGGRSSFDAVVMNPCRHVWEEGDDTVLTGEFEVDDTTLTL